jgi:hypothetical protein
MGNYKQNTLNGWLGDILGSCAANCGFQRIGNPGLDYGECVRTCEEFAIMNAQGGMPPPPTYPTVPAQNGNGNGKNGEIDNKTLLIAGAALVGVVLLTQNRK